MSLSLIGGWLCFAAGGVGVAWAAAVVVMCRLATSWPSVRGEVVVKGVAQDGTYEARYESLLTYRYRVADRLYVGSRRHLGPPVVWRSAGEAEAALQGYRKGGVVLVHYDPRNPRESVLDPRDLSGVTMPLFWALVLVLMGAWLIYT